MRLLHTQVIVGSNPTITTKLWKVNSAGLDSALKAEGVRKRMEFDSTILPPYYTPVAQW